MRPKSIYGGYNCDVSIEPLQSETYTQEVTIRRDEYLWTTYLISINHNVNE